MRSENHPAIPSLEELYHLVKKESEKIFRRYPALLENACREANLIPIKIAGEFNTSE
jgi:hypothetical protein